MTITTDSSSESNLPHNNAGHEGGALEIGLAALYSEDGSIARAIMEWRHRVILLYVVTMGGTGSASLWLYDHNRGAIPWLCYAVAVIMAILGVMDDTNATIL